MNVSRTVIGGLSQGRHIFNGSKLTKWEGNPMKLGANVEYGARSNNSALPDILIRGLSRLNMMKNIWKNFFGKNQIFFLNFL